MNQIFKCKDCSDKCAQRKHGQFCLFIWSQESLSDWIVKRHRKVNYMKKVSLGRNHYKQVKRQVGKYLTQSKFSV